MKKVIAFIGVIGSGKNYMAEEIKKKYEEDCKTVEIMHFADAVRDMMWTLLGWKPVTDAEYGEFKKTEFKLFDRVITGRDLLQRFGTDVMRDMYSDDFWVNMLLKKIRESKADYVLIPDCRFMNEVNALLALDTEFIFCDYKSERYEIKDHASEHFAQKFIGLLDDGDTIPHSMITRIDRIRSVDTFTAHFSNNQ